MTSEPLPNSRPPASRNEVKGELFFSLIKGIGTPADASAVTPLREALASVDYSLYPLKLSDSLGRAKLSSLIGKQLPADPFKRYSKLMDAGDNIRQITTRADALAMETIRYLNEEARREAHEACVEPDLDGRAHSFRGIGYLFDSLMHPEEADRLYTLYGNRHISIATYSPETDRKEVLQSKLVRGDGRRAEGVADKAAELIRRDAGHLSASELRHKTLLASRKYLLNVRKTFPRGDLFLDVRDSERSSAEVKRLVELIFSHPFHTPTSDELGMGAAYAAQLASANVARPVGAAIMSPDGDLLVSGTNDIPKSGGGVYRSDSKKDFRNHMPPWERDPSDVIRLGILRNLIENLILDADWIRELDDFVKEYDPRSASRLAYALQAASAKAAEADEFDSLKLEEIVDACLNSPIIGKSEVLDVIEYSRGLHAEMDAITAAARVGISIRGCTLFTTTFPCHECARLIIGSGIARVVFIEPYDKSRLMELYRTEINMDANPIRPLDRTKVNFTPYVGVAPSRFAELFSWVGRKVGDGEVGGVRRMDGKLVRWEDAKRTSKVRRPIITNDALYSAERADDLQKHERAVIREFDERVLELLPSVLGIQGKLID